MSSTERLAVVASTDSQNEPTSELRRDYRDRIPIIDRLGSAVMTAVPSLDAFGPGPTDADLARAAAAGDRSAFAAIYDRYADRLHDFCIGMLRDRDSAADCVQDTFCTAATRLGDLREPDKLRPWLYSIARSQALRTLRGRRRERPSDDLPDTASHDPGPETLAGRTELASLIAEAAGGLSDRDLSVLELAYRHGLEGPELAEALGVSQTNANTLVYRLRDTIERCLGALLVARRAQNNPVRCPGLAAILHGWDGRFTILMRKRVSRHIESCPACEHDRRQLVNPVALLGATPVFIPAPSWLRDRTMTQVQLTSSATGMDMAARHAVDPPFDTRVAEAYETAAEVDAPRDAAAAKRRLTVLVALILGIPLTILGMALAWKYIQDTPVTPVGETETSPTPIPTPGAPSPTPAAPPPTTATSAGPPPSNPTVRPQPTTATRGTTSTTAAVPDPNVSRTATRQATPAPSATVPPQSPLPTAEPTPPPGDMQAPPPTPAPGPAPYTTYAPPPTAPPPPPAETYKPGPFTEPTFDAPR